MQDTTSSLVCLRSLVFCRQRSNPSAGFEGRATFKKVPSHSSTAECSEQSARCKFSSVRCLLPRLVAWPKLAWEQAAMFLSTAASHTHYGGIVRNVYIEGIHFCPSWVWSQVVLCAEVQIDRSASTKENRVDTVASQVTSSITTTRCVLQRLHRLVHMCSLTPCSSSQQAPFPCT
jgi:hypothetical protein